MHTESFTTRYTLKIERFNKTITDGEAEHTNILYISFQKLFAQPKTSESVVDTCITYHGCEMARSMRLTNKPNFYTFIQRKPLLKFRFYKGCLLTI